MPSSRLTRRKALLLSGNTAAILLAGCLGAAGDRASSSPTPAPTKTRERHTPAPGQAAPITVYETITRDSVEYVEDSHSVRYVAAWTHVKHDEVENGSAPPTQAAEYETVPFDRWATTECAAVGSIAVLHGIEDHLGSDIEGVTAGVTTRDGNKVIVVEVITVLDREGQVTFTPSDGFREIRGVTPESAHVTISLEGQQHSCTISVEVLDMTAQQV